MRDSSDLLTSCAVEARAACRQRKFRATERDLTTRLIAATVVLFVACGPPQDQAAASAQAAQAAPLPTGTLDQLLAPIALYPDPLLAQMLMSAADPAKITELDTWLKANQKLKGTQLQDAAVKAGFDASFVALVLFPQVVARMADQIAWTTVWGKRSRPIERGLASIQEIEAAGQEVGTLKVATAGVETKTTSSGQEVIHRAHQSTDRSTVPQYNTEVVTRSLRRRGRRPGRQRREVRSRPASSGSRPASRLARRWTTTTTTVRTDGAAAATCTTTPGTTTTTTAKTRARTGRITARTSLTSAAIARRTDRNSGPTAPARPRSSAPTVKRRGRKIDLTRRRNAGPAQEVPKPRVRRRKAGQAGKKEQRQLGCILGISNGAGPLEVVDRAEEARARAGAWPPQ